MKVTIDNQELTLGFSYDNKHDPEQIECFLKNQDRSVFATTTIRRHYNDPQIGGNKLGNDKLRKIALKKLLGTYYNGAEHKQERKAIWDAYNNRNK